MSDIKISLVASSIRPHLWDATERSLTSNKIKWEAIMVGPNKGITPLHYKHIYSTTKPAQCYEIGFRAAQGELIHWTADDTTYSVGALDIAYNFWKSRNNEKLVVAFRTIEDNRDITEWHRFRGKDPFAPRMAPFGLMSNKLFRELGGYDRRFVCGQSENDVVMRVYELGGKVEICNGAQALVHHEKSHTSTVFRQGFYHEDRRVLEGSWIKDGVIQKKRLDAFQPFEDKDILTVTQSTKGQW